MKIKQLVTLILLICSLSAISQQSTGDNIFYNRFEGEIGNNIKVTANIIGLFDKLSGNYHYRFIDENNEMQFGETISLNGDINDNTMNLKEFGQDSYTFSGIYDDGSIIGTWNTSDDKELDFNMKEYYPNGTLPFDVFYLHSEDKLISQDKNSPIAEIELTLIFPEGSYFQEGIVDSVKQHITKSFFGAGDYQINPDTLLTKFETKYYSNYKDQNEDWYGNGASFNWQKTISMSVTFNSNYLVCFEYLKYAYTGGAHGMTNISHDIINLDNGNILTYNDIFMDGTEDTLSSILTQQLRKEYNVSDDVPLSKAGFFVDNVSPNHNIYINGNGIGFLYNSYEIAPYANGQTNIFLEFKDITGLLKQGTPVSMMRDR